MKSTAGLDERKRRFIENFAQTWYQGGSSAMDGRVLGFLLVMDDEFISSAELGRVLSASPGSISVSTRRLMEHGMLKRHWIPGDRNHYFSANIDPWGSILSSGFEPSNKIRAAIQSADLLLPELGSTSKTRIKNAIDYYNWIESRIEDLVAEWEEYKKQHGGHAASPIQDQDRHRSA